MLLWDLDFYFTVNPHEHIQCKPYMSSKLFYKCNFNPNFGLDKGLIEVIVEVITGIRLFVKGVSDSC